MNKPKIKPQERIHIKGISIPGVGAGRPTLMLAFGCDYETVWSFGTNLQLWIKSFGSNLRVMDLELFFIFFFESLAVVAFTKSWKKTKVPN